MMVDPDDIFRDLPQDPHLASHELLRRIEKQVIEGTRPEDAYAEACGLLEAFYEAQNWKLPGRLSTGGFSGLGLVAKGSESVEDVANKSRAAQRLQYEAIFAEIMANYRFATKQKAEAALNAEIAGAPGYAILDSEEKKELHKHIEKIRTIIEKSAIEDRKKNSLFERLNDLVREVDRNGTRTDRFFAFAGELSFYIGQFAKNAKPAIEEAKAILKIIWGARERHDGTKLPRPDDVLLLPDPEDDPG
jgi:hypothetical protein